MNRKRILILAGILIGFMLLTLIVLSSTSKKPGPTVTATPQPAALPSEAITTVSATTLAYTIDHPGIADDGSLYFSTYRDTALATAKADGSALQTITPQRFQSLSAVAWSPDANRAVLKDASGGTYLFTTASRALQPLNQKIDNVVWAPDNLRFAMTFEGQPQIYDTRTNKGESMKGLSFGNQFAWNANGSKVAVFQAVEEGTEQSGGELRIYDVAAGSAGEPLADDVVGAGWFKDGNRLVIATKTADRRAVKVVGLDKQSKNVEGVAEFGTVTEESDRVLVTGRATGTEDNQVSASDSLWSIKPDGSVEKLTDLNKRGFAAKLLGQTLHVVTNTALYRINLGGGNG